MQLALHPQLPLQDRLTALQENRACHLLLLEPCDVLRQPHCSEETLHLRHCADNYIIMYNNTIAHNNSIVEYNSDCLSYIPGQCQGCQGRVYSAVSEPLF